MNRIRQERIKNYVEEKNIATIKELQALFPDVSLMTLHRDLNTLEQMGVITKYRGGVRSVRQPNEAEFNIRLKENNAGKISMMKKAMHLLHPQDPGHRLHRRPALPLLPAQAEAQDRLTQKGDTYGEIHHRPAHGPRL